MPLSSASTTRSTTKQSIQNKLETYGPTATTSETTEKNLQQDYALIDDSDMPTTSTTTTTSTNEIQTDGLPLELNRVTSENTTSVLNKMLSAIKEAVNDYWSAS